MTDPTATTRRRIGATRGMTAFRHRNYRLFFTGQAVSLVGTWMQQVAQGWLVLQVSGGDPLWLGIVSAAQFLPVIVFGLFAGVLADVLPKRQTLIGVQIVMMTLAAILAVLTFTGLINVWVILVLALLLGCANAVDMPVRQAFAIEMVGPRDVGNAVSINSAMFNGARVVGPAVAGLTIAAFGIALAFAINAASFLAVIVGLLMMRDDELHAAPLLPRPHSVGEVRENLAEGLRFVRQTPIVLMSIAVVGLVATVGMNFNVIIPPLAQNVLHSDAAGFGFLMTASGVGALVSAVVLVAAGKPRPSRIAIGAIVLGVASLALALSSSFPLSLLLMVPVGAGGIIMAATANATIQLNVPDGLRGRVMSVYTTVFAGSVPVGGLAAGALASSIGVLQTVAVGGALTLAIGLGAVVWYRRIKAAGLVTSAPTGAPAPATLNPATTAATVGATTPTAAMVEGAAASPLEEPPFPAPSAQPTRTAAPRPAASRSAATAGKALDAQR